VPRLCENNPGICLTSKEKARKNLSQGSLGDTYYALPIALTYHIQASSNSKLCSDYVKLLATRCGTSEDKNSRTNIITFNFHLYEDALNFSDYKIINKQSYKGCG
jgi:hypothetical protein